MKKLMIAAAIVCAAVVSQAATFSWYAENLVDETGSAADNYLAFGFIGSSEKGGVTTWTTEAAIELVMSGSDALWEYTMPADDQYRGGFTASGMADIQSVIESGVQAGDTMTGFIVMVNASDMDAYAPTKYSVISGGPAVGIGNVGGSFVFTPTSQGDWQSVPEPTSGLLLLLGVAGLALRRRRA